MLPISEMSQGQSDARKSEYESEHRGIKRMVMPLARVCMNSHSLKSAVRIVAKSPWLQVMARRVARRLSSSTQYRLASIWHRYKN
jgi:hypothetical protein